MAGIESSKKKIEVGDQVESVVADRGILPKSFFEFVGEVENAEPFSKTYGIGMEFSEAGQQVDGDLDRFFKNFPHVDFYREAGTDSASKAIADLTDQIMTNFRTTDLYKSDPNASWQLYGEFAVASVSAEALAENRKTNHVDDELAHVDFIPPEDPCMTYFVSSKYPTEFREGSFTYRGNTVSNYADGEGDIPGASADDRFPSGHLIRGDDSRTVLHRGKLPDTGYKNRVLGRIYIAKKK